MEEFSVLNARDPSILGWFDRPKPTKAAIAKQLLSVFDAEASVKESSKTPLKVYLRIKPSIAGDGTSHAGTFTVLNEHTLATSAPQDSMTYKNHGSNVIHQYTFTKIFGPQIRQKEIFEECVGDHVKDFIIGNNALVFAYGTTNAGKTFTVQGTTIHPGLIPRSLDMIFKSIQGKEAHVGKYKPDKVNEIVELDSAMIAKEAKYKQRILQWDWDNVRSHYRESAKTHTNEHADSKDGADSSTYSDSSDFVSNAYREMQKTISEEYTPIDDNKEGDVVFSLWVSFAEIYNDYVYDLLEPVSNLSVRRIPLKMGQDAYGNVYIKDLRQIHVCSGDEAFQVMLYGKAHLQMAATNMNSQSSRSHSVFTIKLVRYVRSDDPPTHARVSSISFCDLAGAERVKKTLNVGDRLKESNNINASLHVLGRCLTAIKENQGKQYKKQIPFREAKLTRLFQRALTGHEAVSMVVNINCSSVLYDETVHVLKFSAIARQIVLQTPIKRPIRNGSSKSRFSIMALRPTSSICWENPSDVFTEERQSQNGPTLAEQLTVQNEALMEKIWKLQELLAEERKKSGAIERNIRVSLTEQFTKMMDDIERKWKNRLREAEERKEEYSNWRITELEEYYQNLLSSRKRKRAMDDDENDLEKTMDLEDNTEELKESLSMALEKADTYKESLREMRTERECLTAENTRLRMELSTALQELQKKENLLEASTIAKTSDAASEDAFLLELKRQLQEEKQCSNEKTKTIENLKTLLDEARDDFVFLTNEKNETEAESLSLAQELVEKEEKLKDLQHTIDELQLMATRRTVTINGLETKLEAAVKDHEVAVTAIETLKEQLAAKEDTPLRIKELENQLASLTVVTDAADESEELRKKLDEALGKLANQEALLKDMESMEMEKELLLKKIKALEVQVKEGNERTKELESKFSADDATELIQRAEGLEADKICLEKKITSLETELSSINKVKEELEHSTHSLKEKNEDLRRVVKSVEDKFHEFNLLKEGLEERCTALEAEKSALNQRIVDLDVQLRKLEDHCKAQALTIEEQKADLEEKVVRLEECQRELKHFKGKLAEYMSNTDKEHAAKTAQLESQVEELTKWKEAQHETMRNQLREKEAKFEAEIDILQRELKKMLQKNVELEEHLKVAQTDNTRMEQEVKNALQQSQQSSVDENRAVTKMCEDNMKVISALREESQRRNREVEELVGRKNQLENALIQKEKELESFSKNREIIVSRYENQLVNIKDELEREKRECALLRKQLYQNTPTPNKKEYEAEIYKLKEQIKVLTERNGSTNSDYDRHVSEEEDDEVVLNSKTRSATKKSTISRGKASVAVKGSTEDLAIKVDEYFELPKSIKRSVRKKTVDSTSMPAPEDCDVVSAKPKTNRRKLFAPPAYDTADCENVDPLEEKPETTPDVFIKKLRSRSRK